MALIVVAAVLGAGTPAGEAQPAVPSGTRASFSYRMDPRFGLDADGDGRIEIENTHEYAHNRQGGSCPGECPAPRFRVHLTASPTADDVDGDPVVSYEWRLEGPDGPGTYFRSGPDLTLLLPEGRHSVDLRVLVVSGRDSVTLRARGDVVVDDLLVVALGDSYPSGEGSPDVPRGDGDEALWADASDPLVEETHAVAHRSTVGWPARLALALEIGDPTTSVTFVNLAASGASIDRGLLGERSVVELPAQVDEMERIAGDRRIDLLVMQVGGNDIGFSQVVRELVDADPLLDPICYEAMLDNVWESVVDGRWDRDVSLGYDPPLGIACRQTGGEGDPALPGLEGLDDAFGRLASALADIDVGEIVLVEYPDPTGSSFEGDTCEEIVGDATAPLGFHEVDTEEQAAGRMRVLGPLNVTLARVAGDHGWTFVGNVASSFFAGHGYCAPWPDYGYPDRFEDAPLIFKSRLSEPSGWYRPPGRHGPPMVLNRGPVSWYRTAAQSSALQGPSPRFLTAGTMHPNELGHMAIARLVLAALAEGREG